MSEKELSQAEINKEIKKECKDKKGSELGKCAVKVVKRLKNKAYMRGE